MNILTASTIPDGTLSTDVFTVAEVAQLLRVNQITVRRWIKRGVLDAICFPRRSRRHTYRVKRETLEKLLGEPLSSFPSAEERNGSPHA